MNFEDETQETFVAPDVLGQIGRLAARMQEQKWSVEHCQKQLKDATDTLNRIAREDLPMLMREAQLVSITLENGAKLALRDEVECSVSEVNMPVAVAWLKANDFDGIVKLQLVAAFGRGEQARAREAVDALAAAGFEATALQTIHPQTLKAFVKERRAAGVTLPEAFAVFPFTEARLTPPAPKRATAR